MDGLASRRVTAVDREQGTDAPRGRTVRQVAGPAGCDPGHADPLSALGGSRRSALDRDAYLCRVCEGAVRGAATRHALQQFGLGWGKRRWQHHARGEGSDAAGTGRLPHGRRSW